MIVDFRGSIDAIIQAVVGVRKIFIVETWPNPTSFDVVED